MTIWAGIWIYISKADKLLFGDIYPIIFLKYPIVFSNKGETSLCWIENNSRWVVLPNINFTNTEWKKANTQYT